MAKEKDDEIEPQFEDEKEVETEFVNEEDVKEKKNPDDELPEDVKKETKASLYEKLKAAEEKASKVSDPTDRITSAFQKAVEKITPAAPAAVPQPGETEAEFRERLKKDLFDEEKAEGVLNELIDRRLGPRLAQTVELNFKQAEKIMELDSETGPIYKKYKGEIQKYLASNFPANLQKNPQALEYAYKQVMASHIDDIAQERANAILEAERKKTPSSERREPVALDTGGAGGGGSAAPRKKTVIITQADREKADMLGVDASVVAARRSAKVS